MKFPKRWPNRVRKSLTPDKTPGDGILPKKQCKMPGKLSPTDWRCRWFLSLAATLLISGAMTASALAQNAPSTGPVYLPPATAVNNPPTTSASAPPAPAAPQSAVVTDTGDIHDIHGPISIPYEWLWAAYVAASLLAAAALYAGWRWLRRQAAARAKLPFEIALERLEAARIFMTTNTVRDYAFTVSEIIRVYIEQRFGEKAAHRTTEEFLSDLLQQTDTPLAQHRRRLEDFLGHCDLSKFARWQFSVREMESMHESARVFILETQPQPEPVKSARADAPSQPELLEAK